MGHLRASLARSGADRELHLQVGRAASAVRNALEVCGRAARGLQREETVSYRRQAKQLQQAERLLRDIGHMDDTAGEVDLRQEARALCAWLESRERVGGVRRSPRKGAEYQERLRRVLGFLQVVAAPLPDEGEEAAPQREIRPDASPQISRDYGVTDG